jgi:hypothetical protein
MDELDPEKTVKLGEIAGPISKALIVTAAGIFVAVLAVILFNYFSQRATRIATELKLRTDEFLELLLDQQGDSQPRKVKRDPDADKDADKADRADKKEPIVDRNETKRVKGDGDGDREAA